MTPSLIGWNKDPVSGIHEIIVRIGNIAYTYIVDQPRIAQEAIRASAHFNFKHLNKIKKFGRLILKELIEDPEDEEE